MTHFNTFEDAIDFSFWKEICTSRGELKRFRRGEYFIRSGEILRNVGWIKSGGFRHCIIDNLGNTKSVGFVFEGSVLANYLSAMLNKKMPTDIIAIEDSEVYVVSSDIMRERLVYDPTLHISFAQALFEQAYDSILNTYTYSPEQRYRQLLQRYPRIFELVSLGEIASYLNISSRQLHRIRKSIVTT